MKKALLVCFLMLFVATVAFAGIAGSKHDFSAAGPYAGGTQSSCAYCHAPHNALTTAPLWARGNVTAAGSFTLYDSNSSMAGNNTLSGTTVNAPGNNSLTCLSCHDGVQDIGDVAVGTDNTGAIGNGTTVLAGLIASGNALIGTSLANDHPVGIVYSSAASLAGLTNAVVNGKVGGKNWMIYNGNDGVGRVECGSCHNPHDNVTDPKFLKDSRATICSDCHATK